MNCVNNVNIKNLPRNLRRYLIFLSFSFQFFCFSTLFFHALAKYHKKKKNLKETFKLHNQTRKNIFHSSESHTCLFKKYLKNSV